MILKKVYVKNSKSIWIAGLFINTLEVPKQNMYLGELIASIGDCYLIKPKESLQSSAWSGPAYTVDGKYIENTFKGELYWYINKQDVYISNDSLIETE